MIKKIADKRPILFSVIVFIVNAIVAVLTMVLFTSLFGLDIANLENTEFDFNTLTALTLSKVVLSAVLIIILVALKMKSEIKPFRKGIGKGLLLGWFFILFGILQFTYLYDFSNAGSVEPSKLLLLLPLAVYTLFIGVSEEFLCRGIFYNVIFNKYRNVHAAVLISSAVFGIMHLSNLLGGAPLDETLLQVFYAFAFGVLFAAVYVRCKNIWAVVLLHAFFDFCSSAPEILTPVVALEINSTDTNSLIVIAVVSVAAVCIGLFLIRKSKMADISLTQENQA